MDFFWLSSAKGNELLLAMFLLFWVKHVMEFNHAIFN